MRTTIAVDPSTRDRLLDLKRAWGLANLDHVVRRLTDGMPAGARALYASHKAEVDAALERHGIKRLVAYGSRARGDARPDSDLDLAGELPSSASLLDLVDIHEDLSKAFDVPVDFATLRSLQGRLRDAFEREALPLVG